MKFLQSQRDMRKTSHVGEKKCRPFLKFMSSAQNVAACFHVVEKALGWSSTCVGLSIDDTTSICDLENTQARAVFVFSTADDCRKTQILRVETETRRRILLLRTLKREKRNEKLPKQMSQVMKDRSRETRGRRRGRNIAIGHWKEPIAVKTCLPSCSNVKRWVEAEETVNVSFQKAEHSRKQQENFKSFLFLQMKRTPPSVTVAKTTSLTSSSLCFLQLLFRCSDQSLAHLFQHWPHSEEVCCFVSPLLSLLFSSFSLVSSWVNRCSRLSIKMQLAIRPHTRVFSRSVRQFSSVTSSSSPEIWDYIVIGSGFGGSVRPLPCYLSLSFPFVFWFLCCLLVFPLSHCFIVLCFVMVATVHCVFQRKVIACLCLTKGVDVAIKISLAQIGISAISFSLTL